MKLSTCLCRPLASPTYPCWSLYLCNSKQSLTIEVKTDIEQNFGRQGQKWRFFKNTRLASSRKKEYITSDNLDYVCVYLELENVFFVTLALVSLCFLSSAFIRLSWLGWQSNIAMPRLDCVSELSPISSEYPIWNNKTRGPSTIIVCTPMASAVTELSNKTTETTGMEPLRSRSYAQQWPHLIFFYIALLLSHPTCDWAGMFYHNVVQPDVARGKSISYYTPPFGVIV